jgi:triacylglycerol lipase
LLRRALICFVLVSVATSARADDAAVDVLYNREYVKRDSGSLAMDIYMPHGPGPFPGVLVVHGGAWSVGTRMQLSSFANALAEHGYTAACISYRLAPKYTFPAQIYDCQAAVRSLREHAAEYKTDPTRVGGFGYSAGGQLVALLGAVSDDDFREDGVPADAPSARLQVVVAGGAPCDFRVMPPNSVQLSYWLGGTRAAKPDAYRLASPAAFISADDPPMFFFHGARDLLVPARSPQRMVSLLAEAGVTAEMHLIQDAGHMQAMFDRETLRLALEFADKHLKEMKPQIEAAKGSRPEQSDGEGVTQPSRVSIKADRRSVKTNDRGASDAE